MSHALYSETMYLSSQENKCKLENFKMLNKIFHFYSYLMDEILIVFNLDLIAVTFPRWVPSYGTNISVGEGEGYGQYYCHHF